jgi:histidine triad (HIT) family protein
MAAGTHDPDCIFCKIIAGAIPSQRVFEDERLVAFLDVSPVAPGHTIVVPRHHAENLHDLPAEWAAALGPALGQLARVIQTAVGAAGYNVLQNNGRVAGQVVPHVHFHLIPRKAGDGLGYIWRARGATADELAEVAARIRAAF